MKTLLYSVIAATLVLIGCFFISLIRTKKSKTSLKVTNLLLPICILLLFIGLFTGAGINRHRIKKELTTMQEKGLKRTAIETSRLETLEKRNREISWIIGKDEEVEKWIETLRRQS